MADRSPPFGLLGARAKYSLPEISCIVEVAGLC